MPFEKFYFISDVYLFSLFEAKRLVGLVPHVAWYRLIYLGSIFRFSQI